jgi:hypothetical protein
MMLYSSIRGQKYVLQTRIFVRKFNNTKKVENLSSLPPLDDAFFVQKGGWGDSDSRQGCFPDRYKSHCPLREGSQKHVRIFLQKFDNTKKVEKISSLPPLDDAFSSRREVGGIQTRGKAVSPTDRNPPAPFGKGVKALPGFSCGNSITRRKSKRSCFCPTWTMLFSSRRGVGGIQTRGKAVSPTDINPTAPFEKGVKNMSYLPGFSC